MLLAAAGLILSPGCTSVDNNDNYSDMLKEYGQDYDPSTEEPEPEPDPDGADGSAEKPYQLRTAADMENMSNRLKPGQTVYFELAADIDLAGIDWTPLNGTGSHDKFIHFDGKGHIVKNLTSRDKAYAGIFGVLCGDCINTGFVDLDIKSTNRGGPIGGYIGVSAPTSSKFTGRVENCYFTGKVYGDSAGGVVSCIGTSKDGLNCYVRNCYSTVEIEVATANNRAGGIAADVNADGQIINCYAAVVLNTTGSLAGGIAGNVTGAGADVSNSVARNFRLTASGGNPARIAVNWGTGLGENCWAWDEMELYRGLTKVTGIADNVPGSPYQGTAKTTAFLSDMNNYTMWDRTSVWHSETVNGGYPILKWQYERGDYAELAGHGDYTPPEEPEIPDGAGTQASPYILKTAQHVSSMKDLLTAGQTTWFELGADINLAGVTDWTPLNVGNSDMRIHFDGKGHILRNLTIGATYTYAAFFGILIGDCINTGFVDVYVNAPNRTAGGIAGYMGVSGNSLGGRIENCYVTGTVIGDTAGGIVGRLGTTSAQGECYVKNCYTTADVSASEGQVMAAGIAGIVFAGSYVENCYSTGQMTSTAARAAGIAYEVRAGSDVRGCVTWGKVSSAGGSPGLIAGTWVDTGLRGADCWSYLGAELYVGGAQVTDIPYSATPATPYHGQAKSLAFLSDMNNYGWDRSTVWHSATVNGGYPILKWQYERGDYATIAGHTAPEPDPGPLPNNPGGAFDDMGNWIGWQ